MFLLLWSLFLPLCLALKAQGFTEEDTILRLDFKGEVQLSAREGVELEGKDELEVQEEGVLVGEGHPSPVINIDDWNTSQGAMSLWLKPVDWSGKKLKEMGKHSLFVRCYPKGSLSIYYQIAGTTLWVCFNSEDVEGKAEILKYPGIIKWKQGQWHNLTLSWKKGKFVEFYVDGKLEGKSEDKDRRFPEKLTGLSLGRERLWGATGTTMVREIHIFNRPLTESEVRTLAESAEK